MKRRLLVVIMAIAVGAELLAVAKDGNNQKKSETISSSIDTAIVDASTSILKFSPLGNDSAKVTGHKEKNPTSIDIPSKVKIDGKVYKVTNIGDGAFYVCCSLKNINIPEGVTSIEDWAFFGCRSLTSIKIPESVTSIGWDTFNGCSSLKNINIPEGVTSIGWDTFNGCSSLTSITIPEGMTSIGRNAFEGCSSLKSIKIPQGVTSIGRNAFEGCNSLKSIKIPESVTIIGDRAFVGCKNLDVVIDNKEQNVKIGYEAFNDCKSVKFLSETITSNTDAAIVDASTSILKFSPLGDDSAKVTGHKEENPTSIDIPSKVKIDGKVYKVTSIGDGAFFGCSSLKNITIPEGMTSIGRNAFEGCSSLKSIKIPQGVTSIGRNAFEGCNSLKSIKIPESVTIIGDRAFVGCKNLDVVIDNKEQNVKIGYEAFNDCKSVKFLK